MTAEARLRLLASADATMQSYFGSGPFRWFNRILPPNYISRGTCVRVTRISTLRYHTHGTETNQSVNELAQPRLQIDVLDYDPERAASAAAAIRDFLSTGVNLSSGEQFASPPTSPRRFPNFFLNELDGIEPQSDPPVFVRILEVRIFDLEE